MAAAASGTASTGACGSGDNDLAADAANTGLPAWARGMDMPLTAQGTAAKTGDKGCCGFSNGCWPRHGDPDREKLREETEAESAGTAQEACRDTDAATATVAEAPCCCAVVAATKQWAERCMVETSEGCRDTSMALAAELAHNVGLAIVPSSQARPTDGA